MTGVQTCALPISCGLVGRGFLPAEDGPQGPTVAVISHQMWQQRFGGDPAVLDQTLTADTFGKRTYTIVGVMPAGFHYPEETELWLPSGHDGLPRERRGPWLNVIARLADGTSLKRAQTQLSAVQARIVQENPAARLGTEVSLVPLLQQTVGGKTRTAPRDRKSVV